MRLLLCSSARSECPNWHAAYYLVEELRVVPQEEAVAGVLLDHLLVMHLDAGPVPSVARRAQVAATAEPASAAVGAQEARAEAVDPEAPGQEQRVLLRVRAAAEKAEVPEAHLAVRLETVVAVLLLVVRGRPPVRERLDRLERHRPRPRRALAGRREVVVMVVVRAAGQGQGGQVALRAGAAHAGGEPARALVVGSGAREVAGDGWRVVGRRRRLGEVDGRRGDRRRLGPAWRRSSRAWLPAEQRRV